MLRFFYGRDEVVLVLVTYALFLILEDATKLIWGVESVLRRRSPTRCSAMSRSSASAMSATISRWSALALARRRSALVRAQPHASPARSCSR